MNFAQVFMVQVKSSCPTFGFIRAIRCAEGRVWQVSKNN